MQAQHVGRFRIVSVDSGAGSIFTSKTRVSNIAASEQATEFGSLREAEISLYWDVFRERRYWASAEAGESTPLEDEDEIPPQWFIDNLEEEKTKIKAGEHCTSEYMYIYDPEGNRIDRVHV